MNNFRLTVISLIVGVTVIAFFKIYTYKFKVWDNEVIKNKTGEYRFSNNRQLKVWRDKKGSISFQLRTPNGVLIDAKDKGSVYQRHQFLWDSATNHLWFDSSDIGVIVYIPDQNQSYVEHYVVPQIYSDFEKPQILKGNVPSHIKEKLELD